MKLSKRKVFDEEYRCDLTKYLDDISGITKGNCYDIFHHYILTDDYCKEEKCFAIRLPGRTVGDILVNDEDIITKIVVDTNNLLKTYPANVNESIQKFVGEKIEW